MRDLFIFLVAAFSLSSQAFNVGFNQGWFRDAYGHQWMDSSHEPYEVRRLLDLTRDAGSRTLRVWLFEGGDPKALVWKDGKVSGLAPEFLENFEDFLQAARERGVQIYPTLFDGNTLRKLKAGPERDRWWDLLNGKNGGREAFQKNALQPLLKLLYRSDIRPSVFGLDVTNEVDAAVAGFRFEKDWESVNNFTCGLRSFIQSKRAGAKAIPVTASIGWPFIPFYSRGAANLILEPNPHPSCVDFWDIHFYNNDGSIQNCEQIGKLSRQFGKPVYLGEFGQLSKSYSDSLQAKVVTNFIRNAKACGFAGALAWRLSDVREGENEEARHSFEAHGKTRPAYEVIRAFNRAQ